jgi:ribosomal protein S18 acetylase RimI-like enzyme
VAAEIAIRRATPADAAAVADVFLRSFRAALPTVRLAHDDDDVRRYYREVVIPAREAWVAVDGETVVALMAVADGTVEQLYVEPACTGQGIGARLLALAKERSPGGLRLFTFQVNAGARRFYERHGFRVEALGDGSGNEEGEPDVLYAWSPAAGAAS